MLPGRADASPANGASPRASNGSRQATGRGAHIQNGIHKTPALVTNGNAASSATLDTYFGHDREEVTRLLIQALSDMGYQDAADDVGKTSEYELESPIVPALKMAILEGEWPEAEALLFGSHDGNNTGPMDNGPGLSLAPGCDPNEMRFWLREQKFLELLEDRDMSRALTTLRTELTPLNHDTQKLHFLSSLIMYQSVPELMERTQWDGAGGRSRDLLLSKILKCISPTVMLPQHRLATLLDQVKQAQINACLYHTHAMSPSLYTNHSCDRQDFPSEVAFDLTDLKGEIWQIQFSPDGRKLAASGSSGLVIIWEVPSFTILRLLNGHESGVGNLAWSPDGLTLVTCSRDRKAKLWDTQSGALRKEIDKLDEPIIGCVWAADGQSFTLGSLDRRRSIRTYAKDGSLLHDWNTDHRVQDICGSLDGRWIVAVDNNWRIHVYNVSTRELEFQLELGHPISLAMSQDSKHLLVNKKDGEAQLIDLVRRESVQKFLGHRGGEFLIRSSFGGANETFVVSGSEDGNILIWHKHSGAAVERLHGHTPRTNAVTWNPQDPCMIASCGDDGLIKIWSNPSRAEELRRSRTPGWQLD